VIKLTYFDVLPNFGDAMNGWLMKNVFKQEFEKCKDPHNEDHYLMMGSVLHCTTKRSTVWGSGLIDTIYGVDPDADIRLVRGYNSRKYCKNQEVPVGDPMLILPLLFKAKPKPTTEKITVCPHYNDYEYAKNMFADMPNVKVLDTLGDFEGLVNELSDSSLIFSSSLHGLVAADAFNIPSVWIASDNVVGGEFKYVDYFSTTDRGIRKPYDFSVVKSGVYKASRCSSKIVKRLQKDIISTCPLEGLS
jgi:pyruvyltransferase